MPVQTSNTLRLNFLEAILPIHRVVNIPLSSLEIGNYLEILDF